MLRSFWLTFGRDQVVADATFTVSENGESGILRFEEKRSFLLASDETARQMGIRLCENLGVDINVVKGLTLRFDAHKVASGTVEFFCDTELLEGL